MSKNILFVVEGKITEKNVLVSAFKDVLNFNNVNVNVYKFKANIYNLFKKMEKLKETSFLSFLYSQNKKIFPPEMVSPETAFSSVYLLFDLDPQDDNFNEDTIIKIAKFFSDDTINGKVYFSCPMVESIYDFKNFKQSDYNKKFYKINILSRSYKHDSKYNSYFYNHFNKIPTKIKKEFIFPICSLNMKKYNWITKINNKLWTEPYSPERLVVSQIPFIKEGKVSVLNCGILLICDYNPSFLLDFKKLSKNKLID